MKIFYCLGAAILWSPTYENFKFDTILLAIVSNNEDLIFQETTQYMQHQVVGVGQHATATLNHSGCATMSFKLPLADSATPVP
jgi:hypothetical protein